MNWYLDYWKKYATFVGRARRRVYWMFVFGIAVFGIGVGVLDAFVGGSGILLNLFLASLCPLLAVSVRRLHGIEPCGWLQNIFDIFFLMALEGSRGANRYGDDPKGASKDDNEAVFLNRSADLFLAKVRGPQAPVPDCCVMCSECVVFTLRSPAATQDAA